MKYILCFSGGLSEFYNSPRYQADISLMLSALVTREGFDSTRTTVLFGDGTASFTVGSSVVNSEAATKAGLLTTFQQHATRLKNDDMFFFISSNHGGPGDPTLKNATLWCWNEEQITSDDFAIALKPLAASVQVFILGQCYSGGFINSLTAPTQALFTACRFDEVSYATADTSHDEFLLRFATALSSDSGTTLRSVFNAAVSSDTQPEHPQLSDPGGISDRSDIVPPSPRSSLQVARRRIQELLFTSAAS